MTLPPSRADRQRPHQHSLHEEVQFAANACSAQSVIGSAKRRSAPLLDQPLEGPVYLMTGFGHKLPDIVADLKARSTSTSTAGSTRSSTQPEDDLRGGARRPGHQVHPQPRRRQKGLLISNSEHLQARPEGDRGDDRPERRAGEHASRRWPPPAARRRSANDTDGTRIESGRQGDDDRLSRRRNIPMGRTATIFAASMLVAGATRDLGRRGAPPRSRWSPTRMHRRSPGPRRRLVRSEQDQLSRCRRRDRRRLHSDQEFIVSKYDEAGNPKPFTAPALNGASSFEAIPGFQSSFAQAEIHLTVDNSHTATQGRIYVSYGNYPNEIIEAFNADGSAVGGKFPIHSAGAKSVAVDPTTGDFWTGVQHNNRSERYTPDGTDTFDQLPITPLEPEGYFNVANGGWISASTAIRTTTSVSRTTPSKETQIGGIEKYDSSKNRSLHPQSALRTGKGLPGIQGRPGIERPICALRLWEHHPVQRIR